MLYAIKHTMKIVPFILIGSVFIISAACSKRSSYSCYCKAPGSSGFGEPIGQPFPKATKAKAEETCEIFSNTERTCSPVFAN